MAKKGENKSSKKQDQDDSTQKLLAVYRKKCDFLGIPINALVKTKIEEGIENKKFEMFHFTEELGPMQTRALMESLSDLNYQHLKKVRIWKGSIGDQGARFISKYLMATNTLELVDLLDNGINSLGCEFIGKAVSSELTNIKHLKLDDNIIKTEGLKNLAVGLRSNNSLDKLSLKYCGIDGEGAKYLQDILANIKTRLRSLKLQGNSMGNEAIFQILRAVNCCQTLQKINIADTQLNLLPYSAGSDTIYEKIGNLLVSMMKKNMLIIKYDIRFNQIHNQVAEMMLAGIQTNNRIKKIEFPNNVKYQIRDNLDTVLRKRNKIKGGKAKTHRK